LDEYENKHTKHVVKAFRDFISEERQVSYYGYGNDEFGVSDYADDYEMADNWPYFVESKESEKKKCKHKLLLAEDCNTDCVSLEDNFLRKLTMYDFPVRDFASDSNEEEIERMTYLRYFGPIRESLFANSPFSK